MNNIQFSKFNYPISNVELNDDCNTILISLDIASFKYKLLAEGDCCSHSVFKKYKDNDFNQLLGKIIKNIKEVDVPDDYNDSDVDDENGWNDVSRPHLYEMRFKNSNEIFQFQLINYSNGYYDGWMSSSIDF
jgi:hypothetical protein